MIDWRMNFSRIYIFVLNIFINKSTCIVFFCRYRQMRWLSLNLDLTTMPWVNAKFLLFKFILIDIGKPRTIRSLFLVYRIKLSHIPFIHTILSVLVRISLIYLLCIDVLLIVLIPIHLMLLSHSVRICLLGIRLVSFLLLHQVIIIVKIFILSLNVENVVASRSW